MYHSSNRGYNDDFRVYIFSMSKLMKNQAIAQYLIHRGDIIEIRLRGQVSLKYLIPGFVIGAYMLAKAFFPISIERGPSALEYLFSFLGLIILVLPFVLKRGVSKFDLKQGTLEHAQGKFPIESINSIHLINNSLKASVKDDQFIVLIQPSSNTALPDVGEELARLIGKPFLRQ
jgi:hypothetical protein